VADKINIPVRSLQGAMYFIDLENPAMQLQKIKPNILKNKFQYASFC